MKISLCAFIFICIFSVNALVSCSFLEQSQITIFFRSSGGSHGGKSSGGSHSSSSEGHGSNTGGHSTTSDSNTHSTGKGDSSSESHVNKGPTNSDNDGSSKGTSGINGGSSNSVSNKGTNSGGVYNGTSSFNGNSSIFYKRFVFKFKQGTYNSHGSSFFLTVFGIFLFFCSFPVIWYNEKRGIIVQKVIDQGLHNCIEVNDGKCIKETEGSLVCVHGEIISKETIIDDITGIKLEEGIKLLRRVEIFQYFEEKSTNNNQEYTYIKKWAEESVDSSHFHDEKYKGKNEQNGYKFISSKSFYCNDLKIGEYEINDELKELLKCDENMSLFSQESNVKYEQIKNLTLKNVQIINNIIYFCRRDYTKPRLGDLRVYYDYLKSPRSYTTVAKQKNYNLLPYYGENFKCEEKNLELKNANEDMSTNLLIKKDEGLKEKKSLVKIIKEFMSENIKINWLFEGNIPLELCFSTKMKEEQKITWLLRLCGFLLMVFGVYLFFAPLLALLHWIPILGTLFALAFFIFSISFGLSLTLITAGIAWFYYRPAIAACFLGSSILLYFFTIMVV